MSLYILFFVISLYFGFAISIVAKILLWSITNGGKLIECLFYGFWVICKLKISISEFVVSGIPSTVSQFHLI